MDAPPGHVSSAKIKAKSLPSHFGPSRSQGASIYGSARRGTEGGLSCLISRLEGIARGSLASRSQGAPIQMALPVRKQDFAHGLRCSVRGDGGAVHAMLHKLRGMVRRQPAGAAEASPCSAVTAEPALAMPLARLSQLSPGCDPGARSRVMGTPCYALPKHARREKGICRSPLMVGIDKFDYLR